MMYHIAGNADFLRNSQEIGVFPYTYQRVLTSLKIELILKSNKNIGNDLIAAAAAWISYETGFKHQPRICAALRCFKSSDKKHSFLSENSIKQEVFSMYQFRPVTDRIQVMRDLVRDRVIRVDASIVEAVTNAEKSTGMLCPLSRKD